MAEFKAIDVDDNDTNDSNDNNDNNNDSRDNSYDIYIGNLSTTISTEKLKNLFSQIGQILFVWINQKHQRFTYAFIGFYHLIDAKKACEQFNNQTFDGSVIKVSLSIKTQRKLKNSVKMRNTWSPKRTGILLEFPKKGKKIPTKEDKIREILKKDIVKQDRKFVTDFKDALVETENIRFKEFEITKTEPETPDLETLETTVIRYFQTTTKKNSLFKEIDLDLSKGNNVTIEQNEKFFEIFKQ